MVSAITRPKARLLKKGAQTPRPFPQTKKGQMRRSLLKSATAELLRTFSYHELTLDQITNQAGIPLSVFYHYFNTKEDLVLELIEEVFVSFEENVTSQAPHGTWERGLLREQLSLLTLYQSHVGLMRCLYEIEDARFSQRWRQMLLSWRARMAKSLAEFADKETYDPDELFAAVQALGGMSTEFAYQLLVVGSEKLQRRFPAIEEAADFLCTLWMRALFLQHPTRLTNAFPALQSLHDFDTQAATARKE
jgi:AcrR family transcriptional regulator